MGPVEAPDRRDHHGTLSARTLGSGPPLVLLHGLVGSSRYWGQPYDQLADHQAVVPDLLGFGRSPKPAVAYTPDDHVDALVATLDEVGATQPAVVAAHSAGGLIAIRLALRYPERVASITAFGPPLYDNPDSARKHLASMGPMAKLFALPGPFAARVCAWVCDHRDLAARLAILTHPRLPAAVAADSVNHTWDSYTGTLTEVVIAAGAASWLADLTCPVTLVAGLDDRVVDHQFLTTVTASGHRLIRLDGDHHLPLRDPRSCIDIIRTPRTNRRQSS